MRLILPAILLPVTVLLSGCNPADFGSSERYKADIHYTLKPTERLNIETFNGEVEVAGWDEASIEVTGEKYANTQGGLDSIKIDVHESASISEIHVTRPHSIHLNQGTRLLIRAPRKTVIDRAVSSNGAIRIHDMTSEARVETSNGAVHIENVTGNVNAHTSNGAIELDSVTGKLTLKTSNGRVRAEEITGQCEAETSNGPVALRFKDAPEGPVRVHTSNGSVDLTLNKSPKNSVTAETSNGSITVELPGNLAARLNAHTSGSNISSDFDVASSGDSEKEKHRLEGNIGGGGPSIDLSTNNGGIHLRKTTASAN